MLVGGIEQGNIENIIAKIEINGEEYYRKTYMLDYKFWIPIIISALSLIISILGNIQGIIQWIHSL